MYNTRERAEEVASKEYGEVKKCQGVYIVIPIMLSAADVCDLLNICGKTLYNRRKAGQFPAPFNPYERFPGWRLADIMPLVT